MSSHASVCNPGVMSSAARDNAAFGEGPAGDEVVLATCDDMAAVPGAVDDQPAPAKAEPRGCACWTAKDD